MISVPIQYDSCCYDVWVFLEQENLDRIKEYDPAEWDLDKMPGNWRHLRLRKVVLAFASGQEIQRLMQSASRTEVIKLCKELSRGWKYKPQEGDSDAPYQRPAAN